MRYVARLLRLFQTRKQVSPSWNEGMQAFANSATISDNPYREKCQESSQASSQAWESGWNYAHVARERFVKTERLAQLAESADRPISKFNVFAVAIGLVAVTGILVWSIYRFGSTPELCLGLLLAAIVASTFSLLIALNVKIEKEKRRNRIVQAFVSGIARTITNYNSVTDAVSDRETLPGKATYLPFAYELLMENIEWEFQKDFWVAPFCGWLLRDQDLFLDYRYGEDGFVFMYFDLFRRSYKGCFSRELLPQHMRNYLSPEIEVTEDNAGSLEGEVGMFRDLRDGKLDTNGLTADNYRERMALLFSHIRVEEIEKARESILARDNP